MKEPFIQKNIDHCLTLIDREDVDEVLFAFGDAYIWLTRNRFSDESVQDVTKRFLHKISQALKRRGIIRKNISQEAFNSRSSREKVAIENDIISGFLQNLSGEEGIEFLGGLIGQYALTVPEPLFRVAKSFLGMHMTPNIPPIDDNLPMTEEMILYCWQYYWFHSALGY